MRLFEIATVERTSAISIARKIIYIYNCTNATVAEYNWLLKKSEDEYLKHMLSKALSKRNFNYMNLDLLDTYLLNDASELAEALNILHTVERNLHLKAEAEIKQTTDEFLNTAEIQQIAQQKALVDLQNSYAKEYADSNAVVSKLAQQATTL